jgi:hypothetical protein
VTYIPSVGDSRARYPDHLDVDGDSERSGGIVNKPRCKVIELVLGSYIPAEPNRPA